MRGIYSAIDGAKEGAFDTTITFPSKLFQMSQTKWSSYLIELYASRKPPVTGTVDVDKLEANAREALKDHQGNYN
jgi:hypothetical protein